MPLLPQPMILLLSALISAVFCRALVSIGGVKDDIPNQRSSHVAPTPRGGGVAFVAAFGMAYCMLSVGRPGTPVLILASICCGFLGFMEDVKSLPARWRLIFEASLAGAISFGGARILSFDVLGQSLQLSVAASILISILWIVWMTNLYNFMDGVNGIAGSQGVINSVFLGIYADHVGSDLVAMVAFILAGVLVGFLPFNFPRAKIFMGDVGSLFIGFLLAAMTLELHRSNQFTAWQAALLLSPFLADSTFTLLWRVCKRERLADAHRKHLYQRIFDLTGSHIVPTAVYAAISFICGLLLISWPDRSGYFIGPLWMGFLVVYVFIQRQHSRVCTQDVKSAARDDFKRLTKRLV